ncbi:MAG: threonine synthase [Proteobacteria bacterium]|nr:threonine synthase [Pseudomonadota bacterium]
MVADTRPRDTCHATHLECSETGERYPADRLHGLSRAGKPLLVRYDLDAIGGAVSRETMAARSPDMWRWREFLPVPDVESIVSLGESITPLVGLARSASRLGAREVIVKDEGRLPTGSFKARGMALAMTMAKHFGVTRIAAPTAGNAGAAAAAYAAAGGMEAFVFTPEDTPEATVREIAFHGARLYRVNGLINQCARIVRDGTPTMGWHDLSTLEEPYRIEGKKTMGLELAEQLGWRLPDLIYYPTGGGTGFIGMWKAFEELEAVGWIGAARPRMVAVQSPGCGPIVRAFEAGLDHVAEPWSPVETGIHGVRVPRPLGDRLIMRVIYESNGFASDASDQAAEQARAEIARDDGVHLCPEGALCYAAWKDDLASGRVDRDERVVIFNTANGMKSPMPTTTGPVLDCSGPIDYAGL